MTAVVEEFPAERRLAILRHLDDRTPAEIREAWPHVWGDGDAGEKRLQRDRARLGGGAKPVPVVSLPTLPADRFVCARYRCELAAGACVQRQDERLGARGWKTTRPRFPACGPAEEGEESPCEQGRAVRASLGGLATETETRLIPFNPAGGSWTPRKPEQQLDEPPPPAPPAAPNEESPMAEKNTNTERVCDRGCGRKLRASSTGDSCFRCRLEAGEVPGHGPRKVKAARVEAPARAAPQSMPAEVILGATRIDCLPEVVTLPNEYLARCVAEAHRRVAGMRELELVQKALGGGA